VSFILSSENVVSYLKQQGICTADSQLAQPVRAAAYKNFNLIVNFADGINYLVKQERFNGKGEATGCLKYEWIVHLLFTHFAELNPIQDSISQAIYFDAENKIIVLNYFTDYTSLSDIYQIEASYPLAIAQALGKNLGQIHRLTFARSEYREFLGQYTSQRVSGVTPNFMQGLERVGPGIFGNICPDSIEFFKLYQKFPSLHQAVTKLHQNYQAVCVTHDDLRFSNYLIHNSGNSDSLKLIDWEFFEWGDPALDLGTAIAKYLELWLNSLYVDSNTDLNVALSLATCPLEKIQPSLKTFIQSYFKEFPQILSARANYIQQAIQFAGLSLIKHLQQNAEYHQPFDNRAICTLQVAKSLLCHPEPSITTVFGVELTELLADRAELMQVYSSC
jgi:hypothetical protein